MTPDQQDRLRLMEAYGQRVYDHDAFKALMKSHANANARADALARYAHHHEWCRATSYENPGRCTCGLDEARSTERGGA